MPSTYASPRAVSLVVFTDMAIVRREISSSISYTTSFLGTICLEVPSPIPTVFFLHLTVALQRRTVYDFLIKLLFEGSLQQLQKHSRGGILLRVLDAPKAAAVLQQQGVKATAPADQPGTLQLPPLPDEALAALVCALAESGVGVVGLTAQTKSLEDIFLSLTQTSGEVA